VRKVAVLLASNLVPVVLGKLDCLSSPERIFVGMDHFPKVTAPLKILLIDVEIVNVREPAQERWR